MLKFMDVRNMQIKLDVQLDPNMVVGNTCLVLEYIHVRIMNANSLHVNVCWKNNLASCITL